MTENTYNIPVSFMQDTTFGPVEYAILGEGKPILAFHGGSGGFDMSVILYNMFSDAGFSVICPSRPGYLRTPLSSGKNITEQVDLCAALLDELGISEVGVIGASAGGPLTYEFAIRHPEKTKAIIVIDGISQKYIAPKISKTTEVLFLSDPGQKFQFWLAKMIPKQIIKEILDVEGDLNPEELRERVEHIFDDPAKYEFIMSLYKSMYPMSKRKEGLWNDVDTEAAIDKIEVGKITCPALIVHADRDNDVVMAHAEYAVSEIPGAKLHLIEGGTHFGFWVSDHADEAQQRAIEFFKEHL